MNLGIVVAIVTIASIDGGYLAVLTDSVQYLQITSVTTTIAGSTYQLNLEFYQALAKHYANGTCILFPDLGGRSWAGNLTGNTLVWGGTNTATFDGSSIKNGNR